MRAGLAFAILLVLFAGCSAMAVGAVLDPPHRPDPGIRVENQSGRTRVNAGDLPVTPCVGPEHVGPHFDSGQTTITPGGRARLASLVGQLDQAQCARAGNGSVCTSDTVQIIVRGHTDEHPSTNPSNQELSQQRANAAAAELEALGVTVGATMGMADTDPAPPPNPDHRSNTERWADDRRVTLELWCPR